jgi:HPt (histidine-containing phosphotransfer) domain-containing protein
VVQPLANPSVLDISLADEIFTARTTEDADQLRSLIADLRADVLPRIAALQANVGNADLAAVKRELHQIRGVIANFALSAAAARLRELEGSWAQLGPAERRQKLDSIDRDVQAGLLALTARFSFLAT